MSLVSNNIKFLRKKFHFTQEQLAEKLGIKRSLVGAYEEGRAEPPLANLINIAKIFNLTVDTLISRDFSSPSNGELNTSEEKVMTDANFKVLAITVDSQNRENIELVPQKAAAGYLNGYSDPEYLEELPKFQLPILSKSGTYRAFEITGDSMLPLEPGTIIIGQYVDSITDVKNGKTYILLTKKEGVVYKRVFNYASENEKLFLVSDNKVYTPYAISISEVIEIWEAKAFISLKFPDPNFTEEMNMQKLTSIVMELQHEIIKLKEKPVKG